MTDVLYNRPHDHRVWRYGEEWYIFDRSGETPFDCDDGPTILDRDEATVWLDGDTMTVNVKTFGGTRPVNISTNLARWLVKGQGWSLEFA